MTFEEMMKEKFRDLARDYDLQIHDFQVEHFFHGHRSVRFIIRGGGGARIRDPSNPADFKVVETQAPLMLQNKGGEE